MFTRDGSIEASKLPAGQCQQLVVALQSGGFTFLARYLERDQCSIAADHTSKGSTQYHPTRTASLIQSVPITPTVIPCLKRIVLRSSTLNNIVRGQCEDGDHRVHLRKLFDVVRVRGAGETPQGTFPCR
jgi:hypothetical protein